MKLTVISPRAILVATQVREWYVNDGFNRYRINDGTLEGVLFCIKIYILVWWDRGKDPLSRACVAVAYGKIAFVLIVLLYFTIRGIMIKMMV